MFHRYVVVGGICTLALLVGFAACVNPREGYAPEQPIKFSHKVHVSNNEIECSYCHSQVTEGPKASVPGADTCMNCHAKVEGSTQFYKKEIEKLQKAWRNGQSIEWKRVHDLPDHVQFAHQPHILRGIGCNECHGQIPQTSIPDPSYDDGTARVDRIAVENRFNMGWCVDCHRQPEHNASVNCSTCHY